MEAQKQVRKATITQENKLKVEGLIAKYGLDREDIYVFPDSIEPWIGLHSLSAIARAEGCKRIETTFKGYHNSGRTLEFVGTIESHDSKLFTGVGLATVGERVPGSSAIDPQYIGPARALRMAMRLGGYDPFHRPKHASPEEELRRLQLIEIHQIARSIGLIDDQNDYIYRAYLKKHFKVESSTALDSTGRAKLIAMLKRHS